MPYVPRDDRKAKQKSRPWVERALPVIAGAAAIAIVVAGLVAVWSLLAVRWQSAQLKSLEQDTRSLAAATQSLTAAMQKERADVAALKQATSAQAARTQVPAPHANAAAPVTAPVPAEANADLSVTTGALQQPRSGFTISDGRLSGFSAGKSLYAAVKVTTDGSATNVSWRSGLGIGPYPLTRAYDMDRAFIPCAAIGAHERHTRDFTGQAMLHKNGARLLKAGVDNVRRGKAAVYFFGRVCYSDSSQARRYKDFCLYWTGPHTPYRAPASCNAHNRDGES